MNWDVVSERTAVIDEHDGITTWRRFDLMLKDKQPTDRDVQPEFFLTLASTRRARILPCLDDPTGKLPCRLIGRFDKQDTLGGIRNQGTWASASLGQVWLGRKAIAIFIHRVLQWCAPYSELAQPVEGGGWRLGTPPRSTDH